MQGWTERREGWDMDEDDSRSDGGVGSDGRRIFRPFAFFMKPGETKRVMFLNSDPFCLFEHSLYAVNRNIKEKEICLLKNSIDPNGCCLCEYEYFVKEEKKKLWPAYAGYFGVIDMGTVNTEGSKVVLEPYISKQKGNSYQFTKQLFRAGRGSNDKPGILKELQRLIAKRGGALAGTVWDVYRSGDKSESCGDKFDFIERIPRDQWVKYLVLWGASDDVDVEPFRTRLPSEPEPKMYTTWDTLFVPKTNVQLEHLLQRAIGRPPAQSDGQRPRAEGVGYGNSMPRSTAQRERDYDNKAERGWQDTRARSVSGAQVPYPPDDDDIPF